MTKLRNATGLGLLLFMATMIGGLVGISQAQGNGGGVTLASLAGKFSQTGSGFYTVCFTTILRRWSIAPRRCTRRCDSM